MAKEHSRTHSTVRTTTCTSALQLFSSTISPVCTAAKPRNELKEWSEKKRERDRKVSNCSMKNELGRMQRKC